MQLFASVAIGEFPLFFVRFTDIQLPAAMQAVSRGGNDIMSGVRSGRERTTGLHNVALLSTQFICK